MQRIEILRTRFKNDIVTEFLPPVRSSRRVILLAPGCPGYPGGKDELLSFLSKQGYWVFLPRYRGSWESDGVFLKESPERDLLDIIDELPKGFYEAWSGTEYRVTDPEIYLIGGSFGGAAAILASRDARVKKAVAISAVVDWSRQDETVESLPVMAEYMPKAFGMGYRTDTNAWQRLAGGDFYNPVHEKESIDGTKLLLIHAKDDRVVHAAPAEAFAREVGAKYVQLKKGGHMGVSATKVPGVWKHVRKFLAGK